MVKATGSSLSTGRSSELAVIIDSLRKNLPAHGAELGISTKELALMIVKYDLHFDDVDTLAWTCAKYNTRMPLLRPLLDNGETPDDIMAAYEGRHAAMHWTSNSPCKGVPVKSVLALIRQFPGIADDDELGEKIVDMFKRVREAMPWVSYVNQAIDHVIFMAEQHGLADLEAAIDAITEPVCDEEYMIGD